MKFYVFIAHVKLTLTLH